MILVLDSLLTFKLWLKQRGKFLNFTITFLCIKYKSTAYNSNRLLWSRTLYYRFYNPITDKKCHIAMNSFILG